MPNWIEGTMKLRGKRENIRRFFREGLDPSDWPKPEDRENQVIDKSNDDELLFFFRNEPHIKDTRRAFITDDNAYMLEDEGIVCVDVKQAWAFVSDDDTKSLETWKTIANEYDLDIKLFGIECGMCFTQEVIILKGKRPTVNNKQYENWDWECPFPNMGG